MSGWGLQIAGNPQYLSKSITSRDQLQGVCHLYLSTFTHSSESILPPREWKQLKCLFPEHIGSMKWAVWFGQWGTSAQWKFSLCRLLKNFFWGVVVERTSPKLFWNYWKYFFFLWIRIKNYFSLLRYRKAKLGLFFWWFSCYFICPQFLGKQY